MRPPSRTISAARRISRSCGFSGCSSKYWLTGMTSREALAGPLSYAPSSGAQPRLTGISDADPDRTGAADRLLRRLQVRRNLCRDCRAHGRDAVAPRLGLALAARDSQDAPRQCRARLGLRYGDTDPPRRALHPV